MRNMTSLLTQLTLRSARTSSPLNAMKHPNRFSTALPLLVMTLRLLLMVMADMVDMVIRSVKLRLKLSPGMESAVDLSAMPRRTGSATRSLSRALTRSLDKSVFQLQGRNAILLRSRYPDKSAITLDTESSTHLTTAMDMAMADKVFKHLLYFPHTKQCFS